MEIDQQFLDTMASKIGSALADFRAEVKVGFADLSKRVDETNTKLDTRLEQIDTRFEQIDTRFEQLDTRLEQLDTRLDQTNIRLDAAINMVRDFRKDVSVRFDEVGTYLRAINGNIFQHEERITSLERRVDRLDQTG
jgi:chromosome segregation ATPase